MKKILHKLLFFISIIFSCALVLSYLAAHIDPNIFFIPAFFGLAYPYLLCANIFFVIYWMLRKRWSFLLPLLAIVIGVNSFLLLFQFNIPNEKSDNYTFQLMSYNVRLFDRYNWSKKQSTSKNIIKLLASNKSDIICIQEYYEGKRKAFSTKKMCKALGLKHVFRSNRNKDVVIFTRYDIVNKSEFIFPKGDLSTAIYTDIKIKSDTIRIYNIHLESNRFVQKNYNFIQKGDYTADKENLDEIKDITSRLNSAFKRRAKQAISLKHHMNKCRHRYIVAGDFNDTSSSYTYKVISDGIYDSFAERGWGLGITYRGDFPSFRIDYILYSEGLDCINYRRVKKEYSDHYPIKGIYSICSK